MPTPTTPTQLPAGHLRILNAPGVVTHCPPGAVVQDFHIAIVQVAIGAVGRFIAVGDEANGEVHPSEGDCSGGKIQKQSGRQSKCWDPKTAEFWGTTMNYDYTGLRG